MTTVEASVVIDAPPERVWAVVSDPRNLPIWDRHIVAVEGVPSEGLSTGSEYRTWMRFMGVRAPVSAKVLAITPGRYSKIRLHGVLDATVETMVDPVDGGRSRLHHVVDYRLRGGPIGRLAEQGIRMVGAGYLLRRGTQAQKRHIEQDLD
jgi:uncharacterized protein YndB with AHSA1/START domain